eukprot:gene1838-33256_t
MDCASSLKASARIYSLPAPRFTRISRCNPPPANYRQAGSKRRIFDNLDDLDANPRAQEVLRTRAGEVADGLSFPSPSEYPPTSISDEYDSSAVSSGDTVVVGVEPSTALAAPPSSAPAPPNYTMRNLGEQENLVGGPEVEVSSFNGEEVTVLAVTVTPSMGSGFGTGALSRPAEQPLSDWGGYGQEGGASESVQPRWEGGRDGRDVGTQTASGSTAWGGSSWQQGQAGYGPEGSDPPMSWDDMAAQAGQNGRPGQLGEALGAEGGPWRPGGRPGELGGAVGAEGGPWGQEGGPGELNEAAGPEGGSREQATQNPNMGAQDGNWSYFGSEWGEIRPDTDWGNETLDPSASQGSDWSAGPGPSSSYQQQASGPSSSYQQQAWQEKGSEGGQWEGGSYGGYDPSSWAEAGSRQGASGRAQDASPGYPDYPLYISVLTKEETVR